MFMDRSGCWPLAVEERVLSAAAHSALNWGVLGTRRREARGFRVSMIGEAGGCEGCVGGNGRKGSKMKRSECEDHSSHEHVHVHACGGQNDNRR